MDEKRLHPAVVPFFILLALAVTILYPPQAHAYSIYSPINFKSLEDIWTGTCKEDKKHGIIERFVLCTRMTVTDVFYYFIFYVYPPFEAVINAAVTLCVVLFGIKALSGNMENVARESFMLALKVGCVIYFTSNLDFVFESAIDIMDGLLNLVTRFTQIQSSVFGKLKCNDDSFFASSLIQLSLYDFGLTSWPFWKRLDCILNGVIGLGMDPSTGHYNVRFSQGVLAFFIYCLASGLWGFFIFLMGVLMCITLILCALRSVQLYLLCFIMISILSIMGVMFIPLILFKHETPSAMFKKWAVSGMGYIIQPVLMFTFMSLLMTAYDKIMFTGEGSVFYALAGTKSQEADFNLHEYLQTNNVYTTNAASMDFFLDPGQFDTQKTCEEGGTAQDSGMLGNIFCLDKNAANGAIDSVKQGISFKAIDWKKLGDVRDPPFVGGNEIVNVQYNVASAMIMASLALYVFNMFLTYLPKIVGQIGGGGEKLQGAKNISEAGFDMPGDRVASGAIGRMGAGVEAKLGFR